MVSASERLTTHALSAFWKSVKLSEGKVWNWTILTAYGRVWTRTAPTPVVLVRKGEHSALRSFLCAVTVTFHRRDMEVVTSMVVTVFVNFPKCFKLPNFWIRINISYIKCCSFAGFREWLRKQLGPVPHGDVNNSVFRRVPREPLAHLHPQTGRRYLLLSAQHLRNRLV